MTVERNLILVHQPYRQDIKDFYDIAGRVEEMAPDIRTFVVYNCGGHAVERKKAAGLPTLVFSPGELEDFRPLRGKIYAGHFIPKAEQARRFAQAGLPTPATLSGTEIAMRLHELTGLILVKPDHEDASLGKGIQLRQRADFEKEFAGATRPEGQDLQVQSYIDTGPYPNNYRVHTLFGETLLAYKKISIRQGPQPDMSDIALRDAVFQARYSTGQRHEICREEDVLTLAKRAYEAIPEIPLHGCDIIHDCKSGQLYLLEINAGGNTWAFSWGSRDAAYTQSLCTSLGVSDLAKPFVAFDVAARALIEKTRREAV